MLANLHATWLSVYILVAHAPHTFGMSDEEAKTVIDLYWEGVKTTLLARATPLRPLIFMVDANLEPGQQHVFPPHTGPHQASAKPTPHVFPFLSFLKYTDTSLPATFFQVSHWAKTYLCLIILRERQHNT